MDYDEALDVIGVLRGDKDFLCAENERLKEKIKKLRSALLLARSDIAKRKSEKSVNLRIDIDCVLGETS